MTSEEYSRQLQEKFEFYLLDKDTKAPLFEGLHIFNSLRNNWTGAVQELLDHLQALPNITRLDLGVTEITDAGLARLASLPHLRILGLADFAGQWHPWLYTIGFKPWSSAALRRRRSARYLSA